MEHLLSPILATASIVGNVVLAYLLQRRSIATTEYNIMKEACDRLRGELKAANQEIGQLKERTDLQPVLTELAANTKALNMLIESHQKLVLNLFPGKQLNG